MHLSKAELKLRKRLRHLLRQIEKVEAETLWYLNFPKEHNEAGAWRFLRRPDDAELQRVGEFPMIAQIWAATPDEALRGNLQLGVNRSLEFALPKGASPEDYPPGEYTIFERPGGWFELQRNPKSPTTIKYTKPRFGGACFSIQKPRPGGGRGWKFTRQSPSF